MANQHQQHVDRTRSEPGRRAVDTQHPSDRIELKAPESNLGDFGIHGTEGEEMMPRA